MWYKNSYRRHLLDMHINYDGENPFLADFDPDEYLDNLLRAGVDNAMIYLQSHVGYCYYPTKVGHVHPAFAKRPDAMKRLIDGCRAHGISVVVYYSLIYNRVESIANRGWRIVGGSESEKEFSGERYLYCCPNGARYLNFTLSQIKEIFDYADFDGIFFDMPFWPKVCRCANCEKRWQKEHGGEIPADTEAPGFDEFARVRDEWMNEFVEKITAYCKKLDPAVSVEYNLSSVALPGERMPSEEITAFSDYAGGDLYRGAYTHSFACKLYSAITLAEPFECMTSRCPNLKAHTLSRSRDQLRLSLLTVTAHHGANFVIDAIDPAGTMDGRFYKELGGLYRETKKYEKYMKTGGLLTDAGLLYCPESKRPRSDKPYAHYNATVAAAKTLTAAHVPYGVLTPATIERLPLFKCVILSGAAKLREETAAALTAYVKGGGKLYISGESDEKLLALVGKPAGTTDCGYTYLAPARSKTAQGVFAGFTEKYPLPVAYDLPTVKTENEVLATVTLPYKTKAAFSSIHSDPPGTPTDSPAVIRRKLGKGEIVWCAACLEAEKSVRVTSVFIRLLKKLCGGFSLNTSAPEQVEAVTFAAKGETLVSFIYLSDDETFPPVATFETTVACPRAVKTVTDLTGKKQIPFTQNGGKITFKTDLPDGFKMIRIK